MSEDFVRRAFETVRNQRHSFINHLQVISGWLQLERPDRARQHLEALGVRMSAESDVIRALPPAMALTVIVLSLEAETFGVSVDWCLLPPITSFSEERLADLSLRARAAMSQSAALADERRQLIVTFGPGDQFALHTPNLAGEG